MQWCQDCNTLPNQEHTFTALSRKCKEVRFETLFETMQPLSGSHVVAGHDATVATKKGM